MNKAQRLVLMVGVIAVLAVTLFPPWSYQWGASEFGSPKIPGRHAFLLAPPSQKHAQVAFFEGTLSGNTLYPMSVWLDGPRLAAELAGVVLATAGLVLAFWRRPEEKTRISP